MPYRFLLSATLCIGLLSACSEPSKKTKPETAQKGGATEHSSKLKEDVDKSELLAHIPVLGEAVFIEGSAYSKKRQMLYISSAVGGSLQTVDAEGNAQWLQEDGTDGRLKALGMAVDDARDRLWVVGNDGVYLYDLKNNQLLKKNLTKDLGIEGSFPNDITLDADGNAFVSDSFKPNLFKVDGKSLKMSRFIELTQVPYETINDSPFNLNGIVMSPDKKSLLLGKTNDGTLWKVRIDSKEVSQVSLSEPIDLVDGMTWGADNKLYIMRNFKNQISYIQWDEQAEVQHVYDLGIDPQNFKIPTTSVYLEGDSPELIVVNSQFEHQPEPFFLTRVPLEK